METSDNQIIINTKDTSGVIRNINYSPNRNISIINSNSVAGNDATISDLVNLDMTGRTANITNSSYQIVTINGLYGLINYTLNINIFANSSSTKWSLYNTSMTASNNILIRCISCSSTLNPLYININQNRSIEYTDFWISPHGATLAAGTVLKLFFIVN
jgi:hypothetical protein